MRSLETPDTLTTYSNLLAQRAGSCESRVGQFDFRFTCQWTPNILPVMILPSSMTEQSNLQTISLVDMLQVAKRGPRSGWSVPVLIHHGVVVIGKTVRRGTLLVERRSPISRVWGCPTHLLRLMSLHA